MVDGVCEPIAQWRVSASEPKAREREKVEKNSLGGAVDIVVDGVRTNCVAVVWFSGEPGCVAWLFVLSRGSRVAGWIAAWSGGVECSQDVEPGSGVPIFDDGTGGRCEASVEGGVDREETVGTTPEPPGGTRGIADRVVRVRGATRLVPPSVAVLWGDAGVLACGSGYTPVTVGDGGRHAGASREAEVVARFEGA